MFFENFLPSTSRSRAAPFETISKNLLKCWPLKQCGISNLHFFSFFSPLRATTHKKCCHHHRICIASTNLKKCILLYGFFAKTNFLLFPSKVRLQFCIFWVMFGAVCRWHDASWKTNFEIDSTLILMDQLTSFGFSLFRF